MDRKEILEALIRFESPLPDLTKAVRSLSWDADPVVILRRLDIANVLDRFASGELDATTIEDWANLIECREDIDYEPDHEESVAQAIFDLANPILYGPLEITVPEIYARFRE